MIFRVFVNYFIHTLIIFNIIYIIKYIIINAIINCGNVETYINRAIVREYPVEKKFNFCGEILSTKFRT